MNALVFQMIFNYFLVFILVRSADSLVGYDCGRPHPNGTIVSLLEVDECRTPKEEPSHHIVHLELLERPREVTVNVLACRVEIDYVIKNKKYRSFGEQRRAVNNRFFLPIDLVACLDMQVNRKFQFQNNHYYNLTPAVTNSRLLRFINGPGLEESSTSPFGTGKDGNYNNRVYIHIAFKLYSVTLDLLENKILLPTGTSCKYNELSCVDDDGYNNYWSPLFHRGCSSLPFSVVYRGTAEKFQSSGNSNAYVLNYKQKRITLFIHARHDACNSTVYQTEHPRLIIKEISAIIYSENINNLSSIINNVSPYYTISNAKEDVSGTYIKLNYEKCKRKEQTLRAAILNAYKNPNLLAYSLMGKPGYSALIRGEAAHLFRCTPVPVHQRTTGTCYMELPVTANDEPVYLEPRTRTITSEGTEITCNNETAAMYRIQNKWYALEPHPVHTPSPRTLTPNMLPWGRPSAEYASKDATTKINGIANITVNGEKPLSDIQPRITPVKIVIVLILLGYGLTATKRLIQLRRAHSRSVHPTTPPYTRVVLLHRNEMSMPTRRAVKFPRQSTYLPARITRLSITPTPNDDYKNEPLDLQPITRRLHPDTPVHEPPAHLRAELAALSRGLDRLEERINKCTHPMHSS